jgi:alkylhydroperoxidase family enzyme
MLAFLEKLTLTPREVGPADVAPLQAAGLSDEAIADAIHICANFNLINRVSDALGFERAGPESLSRYASFLLRRGYLPPF